MFEAVIDALVANPGVTAIILVVGLGLVGLILLGHD